MYKNLEAAIVRGINHTRPHFEVFVSLAQSGIYIAYITCSPLLFLPATSQQLKSQVSG